VADKPERFATIEQVADRYQVSLSTARAWVRQGIIPCIKIGGIYRFDFVDIDAALKQKSAEQPALQQATTTELIAPTAVAEALVLNPDQDA
jgi:excisionase family DNA binding protein|tara:strand:+ start:5856 stop:6128 length:273 start_codon:yes stop_codon:yes gene_type:complete